MNIETQIINLFNSKKQLTSADIKNGINKNDVSIYLKELVYFGYLEKNNNTYIRTEKQYDNKTRKNEKANDERKNDENYKIALNRIFTGSFLQNNLGHEIINFIIDDKKQRYVYINPCGKRGNNAAKNTECVFHVIKTSGEFYELVAISEIDTTAKTIYSVNAKDEFVNPDLPKFKKITFYDIFYRNGVDDNSHIYTYKAKELYVPNNDYKIIIKDNKDEATFVENNKTIEINLMCNLGRYGCFADATGKKTYKSQPNKSTDVDVLRKIRDNPYIKKYDKNIDISKLDDELCFTVINDRTNLEDSMSNQIAYFLERDKNLTYTFLHNFLGIDDVKENEEFAIIREKENIDLLLESDNHIVVIENKIDSDININKKNTSGKFDSQLSKYYNAITSKYLNKNCRFFVLAPEYNKITQEKLKSDYEEGDNYTLKNYTDLYKIFSKLKYKPYNRKASKQGKFLFSEFVKSIEYLTWSKAKQYERTSYIRLKQRLKELKYQKK